MKKILISLLIMFLGISTLCVCAETVVYNTHTHKYHSVNCKWAAKCTVNCIKIDKKEAVRRGGVPCKVCGG